MCLEIREDYGKEAAEDSKALSLGDDEFEEARAEENAFYPARTEESATRAHYQMARKMSGYATGTANNHE